MIVDTSEVKSFRICPRQHTLSSRNGMHLIPKVTAPALITGKTFHKALHELYMGGDVAKIIEPLKTDPDKSILNMVTSYAREVIPVDLEKYRVLDIEHRFSFHGDVDERIQVVGSIDMIVADHNNVVFGFEHKSTKNFKSDLYLWMDEQPRIYTIALRNYVDGLNKQYPDGHYTYGGIYVNEVRKLVREFQYKRTLCQYSESDLSNFFDDFYKTAVEIEQQTLTESQGKPCPSFMACMMCSFASICSTYMYGKLDLPEILDEFQEEYEVRSQDHLEDDKGGMEE